LDIVTAIALEQPRKLGRSGIDAFPIGLGCWAIGGPFVRSSNGERSPMGWGDVDDDESIRAIHQALDLGVNFFDTADTYGAGHSERILGRALAGRRDGVVIVTKFASIFDEDEGVHYDDRDLPMTYEAIREACEASLRRLQTDYIDVYLLHHGEYGIDGAAEVRDVLEQLVGDGLIRWYGWSTDDPDRARVFAAGEHCTAVEHRLNLIYDAPEMLAVCEELDLASLCKSPLQSGTLTGKFTAATTFPENDGRHGVDFSSGLGAARLEQIAALRPVLARDGRSLTRGALAWILTRSERTIPIPGFKTVAQVDENVGALAAAPLTDDQMEFVETLMERR
jgi:aryl-alcohol dehydrogenase-like predicted oxidoreductase